MKVVTATQMREIDSTTIDLLGCPGEVLMGMAGKAVSDEVLARYPEAHRIAVFCGTGNNGGDGFVAAYLLYNRNRHVEIFVTGDPSRYTPSTSIYAKLCNNSHIRVNILNRANIAEINISSFDLILDSMLGTGFTGELKGIAYDAIMLINSSGVPVLAVDIPSGLPSDGEAPLSDAVRAGCTVTMGLPKVSLVTWPGKMYAGDLVVADIGFPRSLTCSDSLKVDLADGDYIRLHGPASLHGDAHKGERGHLLLAGGFDGMEGAILMAAGAALETGVGLVTVLTTENAREIIAGIYPEVMTLAFDEGDASDAEAIRKLLGSRRYDALVIGPGMGRSDSARDFFKSMLKVIPDLGIRSVLIDGDGLFHAAELFAGKGLPGGTHWVLTPHFLEASRLSGIPVEEIRKNRPLAATRCAGEMKATVLLKGPASIITDSDRMVINTTGNPAMATAGAGDVLSGITGALLLSTLTPVDATALGAYIHGLAGDLAVKENGVLRATDITCFIRKALQSIS